MNKIALKLVGMKQQLNFEVFFKALTNIVATASENIKNLILIL